MAVKTVGTGQTAQQSQQAPQADVSEPNEGTFQSLFDDGAFAPSTNEVRRPVQRSNPDSNQSDDDLDEGKEDSSAQSDADDDADESSDDEESESASDESGSDEEGEGDENEGPAYSSVDELLAAHKIDPESVRSLNVAVKINGETQMIPLAEVLKSYQLEGAITQKSQAFSQQQKDWETERTGVQTLYKQQLAQAQNLGQLAYNQLQADYKAIDWATLEATDPTRAVLLRQKFQDRHGEIVGSLNQVTQAQEAETQRSQQELIANLPKQREKMLEARPEWRDQKKFQAARTAIKAYGSKLGLSEAELGSITDYRHMLILSDAASYAALQASSPETLKKVRAAPQMAKPGARQGRNPKLVANVKARDRFLKNPNSLEAGADYFQTFMDS